MSNDQPTIPTPPQETKKPNAIKVAWRRFKDRMKLTWIGWFYICARRTWGGSVLLFCLVLPLIFSLSHLFSYLSLRPYSSWDELPCQTGTLIKVHSAPGGRGESTGTLRDAACVEHKFYGGTFGSSNRTKIIPFLGQEIKICYTNKLHILPPFYMRSASIIYYPDGTSNRPLFTKTIPEAQASSLRKFKNTLLWGALPFLLWLLKRHGREAWRERRAHIEALRVPAHGGHSNDKPHANS